MGINVNVETVVVINVEELEVEYGGKETGCGDEKMEGGRSSGCGYWKDKVVWKLGNQDGIKETESRGTIVLRER